MNNLFISKDQQPFFNTLPNVLSPQSEALSLYAGLINFSSPESDRESDPVQIYWHRKTFLFIYHEKT